ncbi:hypothetical protein BDV96DRAFT_230397 [Lophiotrema nucula]|uniref:Uncharacterized protein n=1 Tax=Lophiotrema nucula TaxID=690887 RepID=A0A6A5YR05_9PLEO|nr:hypothetical protein BDV96DRAFT_230397 [Lophiotrema nucula]
MAENRFINHRMKTKPETCDTDTILRSISGPIFNFGIALSRPRCSLPVPSLQRKTLGYSGRLACIQGPRFCKPRSIGLKQWWGWKSAVTAVRHTSPAAVIGSSGVVSQSPMSWQLLAQAGRRRPLHEKSQMRLDIEGTHGSLVEQIHTRFVLQRGWELHTSGCT